MTIFGEKLATALVGEKTTLGAKARIAAKNIGHAEGRQKAVLAEVRRMSQMPMYQGIPKPTLFALARHSVQY
jgi:hypothetical protein